MSTLASSLELNECDIDRHLLATTVNLHRDGITRIMVRQCLAKQLTIGHRGVADQLRLQIGTIIERDGHTLFAIDHMIVGDDIATAIDNDARAMAAPCWVVTFTSTKAGRTFAITASRTACSLVPELVLPNCHPANKPTPSTISMTTDKARMAPVRALFHGLGVTGVVCIRPGST
jgi:hypothetical protein